MQLSNNLISTCNKMKKIFGSNIILKLTFASLTAFLLFEEFFVFFIVKPTYTTSAKLQIGLKILHPSVVGMQIINVTGPDDYPDITLCPFPSYNQPNLLNHGYGHSFEYAKVSIFLINLLYYILSFICIVFHCIVYFHLDLDM